MTHRGSYDYKFLNSNGYLDKFRVALDNPYLHIAGLTLLLKIFNKKYNLKDFIVKINGVEKYNRNTLNNILGMDDSGYMHTKPEHNPYIKILKKISDGIERRDIERAFPQEPEENKNPEEDMEYVSQQLIDYQNMNESKKRRIIVTESQLKQILGEEEYKYNEKNRDNFLRQVMIDWYYDRISKQGLLSKMLKNGYTPYDVLKVKEFLDGNIMKAGMPVVGEDGYPKTMPIVALKGTDGKPARNMTDAQLFELLKDKFNRI